MTEEAHRRILTACYAFLLPLARVLLANGISYRDFDHVCRRAFVKTASDEFGVRGRATNASRISAMTGIARKEVQRIRRGLEVGEPNSTQRLSPLADLLHVWATDSKYQDAAGRSRALRIGEGPFEELVASCVGDVPPGAVKTELVRLGAIQLTSDGSLTLIRRTLIPPDIDTRLESSLLYSLRSLAETIAHNSDHRVDSSDRHFERFVESRPLSESEIRRLRSVVRAKLTAISEDLDSLLSTDETSDQEVGSRRVGVGLYYTE